MPVTTILGLCVLLGLGVVRAEDAPRAREDAIFEEEVASFVQSIRGLRDLEYLAAIDSHATRLADGYSADFIYRASLKKLWGARTGTEGIDLIVPLLARCDPHRFPRMCEGILGDLDLPVPTRNLLIVYLGQQNTVESDRVLRIFLKAPEADVRGRIALELFDQRVEPEELVEFFANPANAEYFSEVQSILPEFASPTLLKAALLENDRKK